MKLRERFHKPYGLRRRSAFFLIIAALLSISLYMLLSFLAENLVTEICTRTDYLDRLSQRQIEDLQTFVDERGIASGDLERLQEWERRQPAIFFEVYADGRCIYGYSADMQEADDGAEPLEGEFTLHLADRDVTATLYSDFLYGYYITGKIFCAGTALAFFLLLCLLGSRETVSYIRRLNEEVQYLEGGDLEHPVTETGNDEITELARSINRMREALLQQQKTEQQLHDLNRRIVAEMSHDIRTPLTGMLLYLEILRSHRFETEAQRQEYLEKIEDKAAHMREITDNLLSYSLADDTDRQVSPQRAESAFAGPLHALREELTAQGFKVVFAGQWPACRVQVREICLRRMLENIASNIRKYADPAEPVSMDVCEEETMCGFSVMNGCAPLVQEGSEGTGIGLESIRGMMRRLHGECLIERTDAAFGITLLFPKA